MILKTELLSAIPDSLSNLDLTVFGLQSSGKVREMVSLKNHQRLLVTTDRISAFDVVLGLIPFKGQVLNQLSAWWFEQTKDIVPNHLLAVPDENAVIAKEAKPLPIEVVVRGYLTGSTKTSLWTLYQQGTRDAYGIMLPNGLEKNDPLPKIIITPTTKAEQGGHDQQISRQEILESGLVSAKLWEEVEKVALALFARGQKLALERGLILVDTKYEFGTINDSLILIDEIHTPDSSRYWTQSSYLADKSQPHSIDKEFLRLWFNQRNYNGSGTPPVMPEDFIAEVAARYISAYEQITGLAFEAGRQPAATRILQNLKSYFGAD
jgi:phosphoribosylaminoimidazole-succinocarboxamide synthase